MNEQAIVGSIQEVKGVVVVIRSTGESLVAKSGDVVLIGDVVTTAGDSSVLINVNQNILVSIDGFVLVGNAATVSFADTLFDSINSLLPNSSQENPISIGSPLTLESIREFNEVLASSGQTQTAENESQSNTVIEPTTTFEQLFSSPSAGGDDDPVVVPQNVILTSISRNALETIPNNNFQTTTDLAPDTLSLIHI